jgi:hypothetical protein
LARYSQIKKKEKFNLKFVDLFIDARARTTNTILVTQYLPTPELKIFISEYLLTLESGIL